MLFLQALLGFKSNTLFVILYCPGLSRVYISRYSLWNVQSFYCFLKRLKYTLYVLIRSKELILNLYSWLCSLKPPYLSIEHYLSVSFPVIYKTLKCFSSTHFRTAELGESIAVVIFYNVHAQKHLVVSCTRLNVQFCTHNIMVTT